jgi:hypothetical protein
MSDVLPKEILKALEFDRFKNRFRVDTDHCLKYIRRQSVSNKNIILTAHLPYDCVRVWCRARQAALAKQIPCSFIQIFNTFLYERTGFKVRNDSQLFESRLRTATNIIKAKFVGKNGAAYRKLCQNELSLTLQMEDLVMLSEVNAQLNEQKSINEDLQNEKDILQERCESLVKDLMENQQAERMAKTKVGAEIQDLKIQNQNLQNYIEGLGQDLDFSNSGGRLSTVGERQQRRKITELKTKVEKALWFAKTFGLDLQSAIFKDEHGENHTLTYSENVRRSYKDLTEADQQKVKNILYILDKFCIGDEAYHELSMVDGNEELPRSYLIKQCKDELNKLCHITRTPGSAQGAQLDFQVELESVIQNQVCFVRKWNFVIVYIH